MLTRAMHLSVPSESTVRYLLSFSSDSLKRSRASCSKPALSALSCSSLAVIGVKQRLNYEHFSSRSFTACFVFRGYVPRFVGRICARNCVTGGALHPSHELGRSRPCLFFSNLRERLTESGVVSVASAVKPSHCREGSPLRQKSASLTRCRLFLGKLHGLPQHRRSHGQENTVSVAVD